MKAVSNVYIHSLPCIPQFIDQTSRLLLISACNLVQHLFESSIHYGRFSRSMTNHPFFTTKWSCLLGCLRSRQNSVDYYPRAQDKATLKVLSTRSSPTVIKGRGHMGVGEEWNHPKQWLAGHRLLVMDRRTCRHAHMYSTCGVLLVFWLLAAATIWEWHLLYSVQCSFGCGYFQEQLLFESSVWLIKDGIYTDWPAPALGWRVLQPGEKNTCI